MLVVYLVGPLRAATHWKIEQNVRRAETMALCVWKAGAVCVCPHLNTRFFQGECPDQIWLNGGLELLERSDAILLLPGWKHSKGSRVEKHRAELLGVPIFFTFPALKTWIIGGTNTSHDEETTS